MARVDYVDRQSLPEADRHLLDRPINLFRALANNPEAMKAFGGAGRWIRNGCPFDPRLREMAILQVGYVTNCAYEFSHHVKIGRDFGVTDQDIEALIKETRGEDSELPQLDRLVLRAARDITLDCDVDDRLWQALRAHLDTPRLIELVMIVGHYAYVVRVLKTLKVDVESDWAAPLDAYASPSSDGKWQ